MNRLLVTAPPAHQRLLPRSPSPAPDTTGHALDRAEGARGLRALRLSILRTLTHGIDRPTVAPYVLVKDGRDPGDRLAAALAHAHRAGFTVADPLVDDAWQSDPAARHTLARGYAALRRGEIHGLIAVSQVDISPSHSVYEHELHRLRAAGGFLHLALDETQL
ncbi:hypothetical protein [Streptomyces uncialis]|uniref:hypothetical protein n=1 Tax=Streptomyces uncialis TaxID=1048205 RepID=UPI0037BDF334